MELLDITKQYSSVSIIYGFLYAVVLGHFCVYYIARRLNDLIRTNISYTSWWRLTPYASTLLGILERSVYLVAFLTDNIIVVGFWLGLKLAAGIKRWDSEGGRTAFNVWLIGNLVSIIFALIASLAIANSLGGFFQRDNIIYLSIPIVFTLIIIYVWMPLDRSIRDRKKETE
jgi:hypothetical protein